MNPWPGAIGAMVSNLRAENREPTAIRIHPEILLGIVSDIVPIYKPVSYQLPYKLLGLPVIPDPLHFGLTVEWKPR